MAVTICHSSIDENGKITGGAAGDQTGKEVCTRTWYAKGWTVMLRYKDFAIAKQAAAIAKKLADSNLVGYDQTITSTNGRNTLYKELEKNKWDVDAYIKSGVKTETDCSSFIYAVYCCLIPSLRSSGNAPTTSTIPALFTKNGFTAYRDSKYLTSDEYLLTGDVIDKESGHVAMAITNGSKDSAVNSEPSTPASSTSAKYRVRLTASDAATQKGAFSNLTYAKNCADSNPGYSVYDMLGKLIYRGKNTAFVPYMVRVTATDLYIRKGPGTNYDKIKYTGVGAFTIVDEADGEGATKWGLLKSYQKNRDGWISLDFATKI